MREVLADRFDAFLFDLDGVLYKGSEPVPFAAEAVGRLRSMSKRVAFVTNNSGRTPEAVAARLASVGIPAGVDEIETSALSTAELLAARGVAEAFVVGGEGILRALQAKGIAIVGRGVAEVAVVVIGWDRQVDYAKLRTASLLVERGALLVATNDDASFPAPDGDWPGAGALLAVIETTTGVRAEVVGKPHPPILRAALARAGGGTPLLIGDRLETDVAGAHGLGWDSLLVLTGIAGRDDVASSTIQPTFVAEDLSALFAPSPPRRSSGRRYAGASTVPRPQGATMSALEDVRRTIEAAIGNLTPARAQELAKSFSDPGAAKEQVNKMAGEILDWSQRNRGRMKEFVSREIAAQMKAVGVATQSDLDAVKKRVRDLERRAGMTASGRRSSAKKPVAKKSTAHKTAVKKTAAQTRSTAKPAASTGS